MKYCPFCGDEIPDDALFCPECGRKIEITNIQQVNVPIEEQTSDSGIPITNAGNEKQVFPIAFAVGTGIVALCLLLLVCFMVFWNGTNMEIQSEESGVDEKSVAEDKDISADKDLGNSYYERLLDAIDQYKDLNISLVSNDVSDYPIVRLYFAVEDDYGNPVELDQPVAAISEKVKNEKELERKVDSLKRLEGNQGISIDIVADKSGSMEYDLPYMKRVMTDFVESLDYESGDQAEFISFDSFVMYMCTYTGDVDLLKNGINNMSAYGETALYDALYEGVRNAGNRNGAHCVIGFTDGGDNYSVHTIDEVIDLANRYSVPIYIMGTDGADEYALRSATEQTGGMYWNITDVTAMEDILSEIYTIQKDMYCLSYQSDEKYDPYEKRNVSYIIGDDTYCTQGEDSFEPVETKEMKAHSSRYELVKADTSWTEANEEAIAQGGHLITITTQEELETAERMADDAGLKYIWIGGYTSVRDFDEVYGHWVTGEDFEFQAWYEGEPSRNDLDGTPEMYLMLWKIGEEWSWNDQRDNPAAELTYFDGNMGYIIEYED